MKKKKLIIIGGGAAGLFAARMLVEKYEVTIIESRDVMGGRMRSLPLDNGYEQMDAGAEFIHGDGPLTHRLVKEAGLTLVASEGRMLTKEGKQWKEQQDMIDHWDKLLKLMSKQHPDITLDQFLIENYSGDEQELFRAQVRRYAEGFDLADPAKASVQSLYEEWSDEPENYRLKEGYGALIGFLEQKCVEGGCEIIRGTIVRQIDWVENDVTAYTHSGEKFTAEKLLVTIPVSLLSDIAGSHSINFTPPIDNYVKASLQIGFGNVIKVVIKFKEVLWPVGTGFIFSNEMIPTWWTQFPSDNNTLTGWAGGPVAERLSQHSDQELLQIASNSLANIFDYSFSTLTEKISEQHVFNWKLYPETRGAYSYSTPQSKEARKLLNTSLANTVFFAGEGFYTGKHSGTVEAAFSSAHDAAQKLLKLV